MYLAQCCFSGTHFCHTLLRIKLAYSCSTFGLVAAYGEDIESSSGRLWARSTRVRGRQLPPHPSKAVIGSHRNCSLFPHIRPQSGYALAPLPCQPLTPLQPTLCLPSHHLTMKATAWRLYLPLGPTLRIFHGDIFLLYHCVRVCRPSSPIPVYTKVTQWTPSVPHQRKWRAFISTLPQN